MKKLLKIGKCVLLYGTLVYFAFTLLTAESLGEIHYWFPLITFSIFIVLAIICRIVFKDEDIKNYIPKWFFEFDN